jgi:hypothetical protein
MLDFNDRDLVRLCEEAQFERIHLELHVDVSLNPPYSYDAMINSPGNPRVPPMAQVMQEIFTAEEIIRFEEHVRPAIESGRMVQRDAVSYVRAVKAGGEARVQEDDNDG